jgi:hypothetical protein
LENIEPTPATRVQVSAANWIEVALATGPGPE